MSAPSSVLLLHGWQNRREADHWQSRVAGILRERGVQVVHPQLPDPDEPDPDAWAATARAALAEMTPGHRVVACHSLGCILWARIAGEAAAERVCWVAPPGPDELRAYKAITAFLPEEIDAGRAAGLVHDGPAAAGVLGRRPLLRGGRGHRLRRAAGPGHRAAARPGAHQPGLGLRRLAGDGGLVPGRRHEVPSVAAIDLATP